jgi:hypothetical protein
METEDTYQVWLDTEGLSSQVLPQLVSCQASNVLVPELPMPGTSRRLELGGTMLAVTMPIRSKTRRLEQRGDGLWYLADAEDQVELGNQVKSYMEWYKESDDIRYPKPKSTMCYS